MWANKNYRTFMNVVHDVLNDDGMFLLETIGGNRSVKRTDPWIDRYIFPNSMNPSIAQIGRSIEPVHYGRLAKLCRGL